MTRKEILTWLHSHPDVVHGDADTLVDRTERETRRHAAEDAWLAAKRYVERCMHEWEERWGFHASDAYVAREVCLHVAKSLRDHEPHFEHGDEEHLAGRENLEALDPVGRERMENYVLELAEAERHRIWREIVRFTRDEARVLERSGEFTRDLNDWDGNANYMARAARIAHILADEFESHAHQRPH